MGLTRVGWNAGLGQRAGRQLAGDFSTLCVVALGAVDVERMLRLDHEVSLIDHAGRVLAGTSFNFLLNADPEFPLRAMVIPSDPGDPVAARRELPNRTAAGSVPDG